MGARRRAANLLLQHARAQGFRFVETNALKHDLLRSRAHFARPNALCVHGDGTALYKAM